jgi:serine/threonine protein phosphatase PrpC
MRNASRSATSEAASREPPRRRRWRWPWRWRWPRLRRRRPADDAPPSSPTQPPARRTGAESVPPPAGRPPAAEDRLPPPPRVGRIAGSWRRRLADEQWPRSGLAADCGRLGDFALAAASAVGRSHAHEARPRQDSYGFATIGSGVACAIADGVSQTPHGGPAADAAVAAALTALTALTADGVETRLPPSERLEHAVETARAAVERLARELAADAPDQERLLATTLLLAVADASDGQRLRVFLASVGDSCALQLDADGEFAELIEASAGTGPLSDYLPKRSARLRIERFDLALDATLLLATDGVARDLQASETVRRWVAERLPVLDNPLAAAHLLAYERQGSSDDLTFLALRRVGGG